MSFSYLKKMPDPDTIKSEFALTPEMKALKADRDQQIADIITGKDDRVLAIIGPCSADNEDSVCEYVNRLTSVQEKIKDRVLIVPRIYTNKPRTTGSGYKGIASQPDPTKAPDMVEGLIAMRKMHLRAIRESGFTCADEMLYPENWPYVEDLLSYVAIGARSVEDQHHRLTVSGFDVASGMKNPTSGDFSVMLNSVYAAQHAHHFTFSGYEVQSFGAYDPARGCQQAWQLCTELPLRGSGSPFRYVCIYGSCQSGYDRGCQPLQLQQAVQAADPYRP